MTIVSTHLNLNIWAFKYHVIFTGMHLSTIASEQTSDVQWLRPALHASGGRILIAARCPVISFTRAIKQAGDRRASIHAVLFDAATSFHEGGAAWQS